MAYLPLTSTFPRVCRLVGFPVALVTLETEPQASTGAVLRPDVLRIAMSVLRPNSLRTYLSLCGESRAEGPHSEGEGVAGAHGAKIPISKR